MKNVKKSVVYFAFGFSFGFVLLLGLAHQVRAASIDAPITATFPTINTNYQNSSGNAELVTAIVYDTLYSNYWEIQVGPASTSPLQYTCDVEVPAADVDATMHCLVPINDYYAVKELGSPTSPFISSVYTQPLTEDGNSTSTIVIANQVQYTTSSPLFISSTQTNLFDGIILLFLTVGVLFLIFKKH